MSYPESEGLQVAVERDGLLVNPDHGGLEHYTKVEPTKPPVEYYKQDTVVEDHSAPRDGRICGVAKRTFWILLVVAIVIVAAAVGGGVGGSIAAKNANKSEDNQSPSSASPSTPSATPTSSGDPTSSSTPTSSVTPAEPFPTAGVLPLDCPARNETHYSTVPPGSSKNYTYRIDCDVNYKGADLKKTKTNTIDLCIDECAKMSDKNPDKPCGLIVWIGNVTLAVPNTGGNCFLKADVVAPNQANPTDNFAGAVWVKQ
ncbi:hypothetical protein V490_06170 [Pseudogymnoascus sp. VKM F-3557]|nr:hypothetical protein V490_06170 [Pseudogymnoascus sp. VKM F-3557]